MESRLNADFSRVRLHTDGPAAQAADDLGARAFAQGDDVVFAPGEYAPERPASQELLAHELTHVAQQAQAGATAMQFDPKSGKAGIGAAPPEEDFIKDPGNWGAEDGHLLFKSDQAEPDGGDAALQKIADAVKEPSYVHVHGYASAEGPGDYNLNLSAHRGAVIKHRLEKLLPPGSKVYIFAHGESRHFGAAEANRRAGVSLIGPVDSGFKLRGGLGTRYRLGGTPPPLSGPGLTPPTLPGVTTLPPTSVATTPPLAPFVTVPPTQGTPRSLMDNAGLLAPGALHGQPGGIPMDQWDASYRKYHALGIPDELSLGPFDLGAGALANKELTSAIQAYHERNDPTAIETSNAEVGAHVVMSPNLLELGAKKKKKGDK